MSDLQPQDPLLTAHQQRVVAEVLAFVAGVTDGDPEEPVDAYRIMLAEALAAEAQDPLVPGENHPKKETAP